MWESGGGIVQGWTWYFPRVVVVLSKSRRGILRDMRKQSPTPTPTSSSLLKLVQVQSQVRLEVDNTLKLEC